jgi:hypothetical protein
MRWFTLLLQIVIPAAIAVWLTIVMGFAVQRGPPVETPAMIILGGAVIGLFAWLPGLIVDRASLNRLVLTVALSILGVTVSVLLLGAMVLSFLPGAKSPLMFFVAAPPLAGAMAGYYWPWRKPHVEGQ